MTNTSRDISSKLDPRHAEVLIDIVGRATAQGVPLFILGATARDIVFVALYDIPAIRATIDIDLALKVESWDDYYKLRDTLLATGRYHADRVQLRRLTHVNGAIIDLVPFGQLETPAGVVAWPPDQGTIMRTTGFQEALDNSLDVVVSHDPECHAKVCTPAALATMKIVSWDDNYPSRERDAEDLYYMLKEYVRAGNESRLYDSDSGLFAASGYDYEQAGARMLGRDVGELATLNTRARLVAILGRETSEESQFRLVSDMTKGLFRVDTAEEKALRLLEEFKTGFLGYEMTAGASDE